MSESTKRALVFGGSGTVGRCLVRRLLGEGIKTSFTWYQNQIVAKELEAEGATAHQVDLTDLDGLVAWLADVEVPDIGVYAAGSVGTTDFLAVDSASWQSLQTLNCQAAFVAIQQLAPRMTRGGQWVLLGALDRSQSLPLPVAFSATQGMLSAMVMSLAKELGPRNIRINLVSSGLLEEGLSQSDGAKELQRDFLRYSAFRRLGKPDEVARGAVWLALNNRYMTGRVLPINGGI